MQDFCHQQNDPNTEVSAAKYSTYYGLWDLIPSCLDTSADDRNGWPYINLVFKDSTTYTQKQGDARFLASTIGPSA